MACVPREKPSRARASHDKREFSWVSSPDTGLGRGTAGREKGNLYRHPGKERDDDFMRGKVGRYWAAAARRYPAHSRATGSRQARFRPAQARRAARAYRSEEHTSELQSLMRI